MVLIGLAEFATSTVLQPCKRSERLVTSDERYFSLTDQRMKFTRSPDSMSSAPSPLYASVLKRWFSHEEDMSARKFGRSGPQRRDVVALGEGPRGPELCWQNTVESVRGSEERLLVRVGVLHLSVIRVSDQSTESQRCSSKLLQNAKNRGWSPVSMGKTCRVHSSKAYVEGDIGIILMHVQAHVFTSLVPSDFRILGSFEGHYDSLFSLTMKQ